MDIYEWIDKLWYSYTVGYYSAIKMKGILVPATTRVHLEETILREPRHKGYMWCNSFYME